MKTIHSATGRGRRFLFKNYFIDIAVTPHWWNTHVWYFSSQRHFTIHLFPFRSLLRKLHESTERLFSKVLKRVNRLVDYIKK